MKQRETPGYYPKFSTLKQQDFWDEATRNVVLKRVNEVPPIRFFTPSEAALLEGILTRVLPQDDRVPERRIPLLNYIDDRLYHRRFDGYTYEDMPDDDEAHRRGLRAVEKMADTEHKKPFLELSAAEQEQLLKKIHDASAGEATLKWEGLSPAHYWSMLMQDAVSAYYAHPYAWDEIGFGGPAYPRGYIRPTDGLPEPWEVKEERYIWNAPEGTITDRYDDEKRVGGREPNHGQSGTH